jgi:hypothetical protein
VPSVRFAFAHALQNPNVSIDTCTMIAIPPVLAGGWSGVRTVCSVGPVCRVTQSCNDAIDTARILRAAKSLTRVAWATLCSCTKQRRTGWHVRVQ